MLIPVKLKDGSGAKVSPQGLQNLIQSDLLISFRRSGHWAVAGRDPVRRMGEDGYGGKERRSGGEKTR